MIQILPMLFIFRYSNAFIAGHKVQVFPYHHLSDAMAQAGQLPIAWNHFYQGNVPAQHHGIQLYGSLMNTNMHNKTMPAETFLANVLVG